MKRREFITLLGGAAAWPLAARAQQGERMRRIGVLMGTAETIAQQAGLAVFIQLLHQLGWTEDRNVQLEIRWGGGDPARVRRYAEELVALPAKVIMTNGALPLEALLRATRSVPINIRQCHRSGWQRLCRKLGATRWQRNRVHSI